MGEFVTVSAFRTDDAGAVRDAAVEFFSAHAWSVRPVEGAEPVTDDDVLVHPATHGWTVVVWPGYFTELAAVADMSGRLGLLASTVRIHDGDYWSHTLMRDGVTLDRFATMPDYFTDDADEIARLRATYAGRPAVVASAIGCSQDLVAPYLIHIGLDEELGKAFPDDEFELDSPWVFVDFWRRLGIRYPDGEPPADGPRLRLAPGWLGKLPTGDAEL
ncbi:hypothetical protein WEI85_30595 [Actinomycetes bacterium KLBMP 9797]